MRLFKRITALAMAAVTAGALGLGAAAEVVNEKEEMGGYTVEERANWDINDYAENIKTVYKLTYPNEADVIDGIVDAIVSSETFAGIFEEEGKSAFLIVEDSLRNALEPSAAPLDQNDECYYSKYSVSTITQSDYGTSAAAATLMALIGSGVSGYNNTSLSTVQNELNEETSTTMTISKITKVLKKHIPDRNGYTVKMVGCVPNKYNTAYELISRISDALVRDTVPIIQIEDTSLLDYYKGKNVGTQYLAVTEVDTLAQCIVVLDPNKNSDYNGSHNIDYDDLDILLRKAKVIWMSGFVADKTCSGLEAVMAEYPAGSSYFNHTYENAYQCAAFARYVYENLRGLSYLDVLDHRIQGFGGRNYSETLASDRCYYGKEFNEEPAKQNLMGLPSGTYVRVDYIPNVRVGHAFSIVETTNNDITIYHANYFSPNKVSLDTWTWEEFDEKFDKLNFYVD